MSVLQKLTEGLVKRDLQKQGAALMDKWERTGLLEGIGDDNKRNSMARLLENQASQLLKEASSMAGGDVEGFASVAFPIVRRVFGGLIANDLVSVQPMSLPSGLIFFMDFTFTDQRPAGGENAKNSLYGGGVVGSQLTGGVSDLTEEGGGFYNLQSGYASATGSHPTVEFNATAVVASTLISDLTDAQKKELRYDADLLAQTTKYVTKIRSNSTVTQQFSASLGGINKDNLIAIEKRAGSSNSYAVGKNAELVRRLTEINSSDQLNLVLIDSGTMAAPGDGATDRLTLLVPTADTFNNAYALGAVVGGPLWALEGAADGSDTNTVFDGNAVDKIPEIDIKVDSVSVTAVTKKLKAKWTPELGQDLNAYHNLDAEVELTSILSEQIALEIDREIVNDLVQGAKAGTYYWSRSPGLFVKKDTGAELGAASAAPDFTGTVSEWYETLVETINDVSAQIHRKTLRGGATFLVTSPEVANILEFTSGFRASVTHDADKGTVGAVNVGSLSKKWDVWVDPYFPRNLVLIGRKGGSFLESGYVYAPYVPLQVTPTIFGTEDFVPRKGVMTRYAKKMVRPDMYGLVVVRGILGEEGSS
tara:strand:- start:26177 stop:27946 length:1770 start_codon:yes stop_codon:yes gene_type:complete